MDVNGLIKDLEKLEKITREQKEIKKPEYINKRVVEVFPDSFMQQLQKEINAGINDILSTI